MSKVILPLFVLLGILRLLFSFFVVDLPYGFVEINGCIVAEPDVRDFDVRYYFEIDEGRVLLKLPKYPVYEYGDCLFVSGVLEEVPVFDGFDYARYLSIYNVYGVLEGREVLSFEEGSGFLRLIYKLKRVFENRLNDIYAEPHGSFMAGLILGSRRGIDDDLMENFNRTGLTHIVAISGYNITLVVLAVNFLFGFLPLRRRFWLSGAFIFCFVVLVGASASVVRAGIMGVLSLYAIYLGRSYVALRALFISALFMGFFNPKLILYDVGFQLSFLSTLGLILVADNFQNWFRFLPAKFLIRETLAMTLSSQIFTLPIVIMNFGRISVVSVLANLFVLPFVPLAMLFGMASVFFGSIFGFFGFLCLELIVMFVNFFASFSWASFEVSKVSNIIFVIYYICLCYVFRRKFRYLKF